MRKQSLILLEPWSSFWRSERTRKPLLMRSPPYVRDYDVSSNGEESL